MNNMGGVPNSSKQLQCSFYFGLWKVICAKQPDVGISANFVLLIPLPYLNLIIVCYLLSSDSPPVQRNTRVHLDDGDCWSGPAAVYKEKPHRAILEETFAKMYRNMYQKTAGAVSNHKTYS